jgi:hypothetical protein
MTVEWFCGKCIEPDVFCEKWWRKVQRVSLYCSHTCGNRGVGEGWLIMMKKCFIQRASLHHLLKPTIQLDVNCGRRIFFLPLYPISSPSLYVYFLFTFCLFLLASLYYSDLSHLRLYSSPYPSQFSFFISIIFILSFPVFIIFMYYSLFSYCRTS